MLQSPHAGARPASVVQAETGFLTRVYAWMTGGLLVTASVAFWVAGSPTLVRTIAGNPLLFFGLILGELGLVVALSAALPRLSFTSAAGLFLLYSALNGATLSVVLLVYTAASVASAFLVTSGTFGAMTLYGLTTRRDLGGLGSYLFMGLVGLVMASMVNLFLRSPGLDWLISYAGVLLFVGLTAYDTQKLRKVHEAGRAVGEEGAKLAVYGALRLYLDFINLFLLLLRILGNRRD